MFDPITSILIGLLLMVLALLLGRESGALLVGERTDQARIDRVRQLLREDASVEGVGDVLTMQLGPEEVLLTVDIRFRRKLDVQELESAIDRIESRIRGSEPTIKRIFLEADSLRAGAGSHPDRGTADATAATRAKKTAPNAQSAYGRNVMAKCEVCGNEYDKSFEVVAKGARHTFDSFECAIQALAPTCSQCSCRVIGHGVEISGQMFCCAHCANAAGRATGVRDRAA